MTIQAIKNRFYNSYLVTQFSSLIRQTKTVYNNNMDAEQELKGAAILTTAGAGHGLVGRGIFMFATASFSIPSLIFYSLIGGLVGTIISIPITGSFLTCLHRRVGMAQQQILPHPQDIAFQNSVE